MSNPQAVCELYKKSLQKLDNDFAPISGDLTQLVITLYQRSPNTAVIDLCKQVICSLYSLQNVLVLCHWSCKQDVFFFCRRRGEGVEVQVLCYAGGGLQWLADPKWSWNARNSAVHPSRFHCHEETITSPCPAACQNETVTGSANREVELWLKKKYYKPLDVMKADM